VLLLHPIFLAEFLTLLVLFISLDVETAAEIDPEEIFLAWNFAEQEETKVQPQKNQSGLEQTNTE